MSIVRTRPRFNEESPDFLNWIWGWVRGYTYPRHNTRPRHISLSV